MIVNESDRHFKQEVTRCKEEVRDHKGVNSVDFVFESGSIPHLGALDCLSERRKVDEGVEQEPDQEEGVGVGVPEVLERGKGRVDTNGAARGAAENEQSKDHGWKAEGHQECTNGAKKLILTGLWGPLKRSLLWWHVAWGWKT